MQKRVSIRCRQIIRKRKEWRLRALKAAIEFATFPAGKPGREKVEAELHKSLSKIDLWYRGGGVAPAAQSSLFNAERLTHTDHRRNHF